MQMRIYVHKVEAYLKTLILIKFVDLSNFDMLNISKDAFANSL